MSLEATVLAIVPFCPFILDQLEGDPAQYRNVKNGTPVLTELFHIRTSSSSRELADLLGVNLDDISTYNIPEERARAITGNVWKLQQIGDICDRAGTSMDEVVFADLARIPGIQFFFRAH